MNTFHHRHKGFLFYKKLQKKCEHKSMSFILLPLKTQ